MNLFYNLIRDDAGERIKFERKAWGMSRKKLARLAYTDPETIEYIEKADRDKQWFVVADIHIVFNSEKGAEQFANKYGLNYQLSEYGERYYTVCLKDTAIAVDEEFDDFIEFASQEYNDYIFGKIKLTDKGTLVDISTNESSLVYY